MASLKAQAIKSVLWVGSTKMIGQTFSWAVTLVLIRLLSPEDFGAMGMVMTYQAVIIVLYDLSLGEAVIQKPDLEEEDSSTCFWFTLGLGACFSVITWVLAPWVADFFNTRSLVWMLRVSSIGILCLCAKEIHTVLLCRKLDFEKRAKAQLFSSFLSLLVSLILAWMNWGVWSLVWGLVANHFFHTIFVLNYVRWRPMWVFSWRSLFNMFRFAIPLVGANFLRYVFHNSDSVIVGKGLGADVLGHYRVAMDFSRIPIEKFIIVINQVCFPVFAKLQNDPPELRAYFLKVIRYTSIMAFPMLVGMFLVAREIVVLVLTPKWLPALYLLQIFCFLAIFESFQGTFTVLLKSIGRVGTVFRFTLLNTILLPLGFIAALPFGVEAIAGCWLIMFPVLMVYLLTKVCKTLGMSFSAFLRAIRPASEGTLLMAVAVMAVRISIGASNPTWHHFALLILAGATTYGMFFVVFHRPIFLESVSLVRTALERG